MQTQEISLGALWPRFWSVTLHFVRSFDPTFRPEAQYRRKTSGARKDSVRRKTSGAKTNYNNHVSKTAGIVREIVLENADTKSLRIFQAQNI
jgi:hypothetical protein